MPILTTFTVTVSYRMIGRAPKTLIMLISPVDTLLINALKKVTEKVP